MSTNMSLVSVTSGSITVKFLNYPDVIPMAGDVLESAAVRLGEAAWSIEIYPGGLAAADSLAPCFLRSRSLCPCRATFTLCAADETGHEALSGPNLEKVLFRGGEAVKGATFGAASLLSFCTTDGTLTIHAHITLHEIASSREEDCVLTANDDLRITGCRSGLRQSFLDLYDHEDMPYDVWLSTSAGGEPEMMVGAHKFVLAARSPVFRAMFSGGLAEAQGYEVNITDFTADAVQAFVRFLYSDLCSHAAMQDCANELLAMADKYQVPALSILCERYLAHSLRPESAIGVLKLADAHNVPQLKALALFYLVGNPGRTAEHAQDLSAELVRDLLRIVEVKVTGASF